MTEVFDIRRQSANTTLTPYVKNFRQGAKSANLRQKNNKRTKNVSSKTPGVSQDIVKKHHGRPSPGTS